MAVTAADIGSRFAPYLPRLATVWAVERPAVNWQAIEGSLVFVDVSGFTALSERLAKRGPVGAEELTEVISSSFAALLSVAYADGGSLLKFGGDALLLLFEGDDHAGRAVRSAMRMRTAMRTAGRLTTTVGNVRLRMSVGVHGGELHLFRVGRSHKELLVCGPAASEVVTMEGTAAAGEIVVSPGLSTMIDPGLIGERKGPGFLVRDRRLAAAPDSFPAAPATSELVASALPVALRDHLAAGAADSEHRHASIAFVHFDGTDRLLETDGPDTLAHALDELVVDVQAAADDQGVTFLATDVDHDGGKIILVAGVPRALGDDEGRLLRAVRSIADGERVLPVRVGVHRGSIFAGEVGPAYRRTYTVMGDAVNLAARLMAKAAPGQILASERVLERSRTAFASTPLEPFFVKGKAKAVEAFALGRALGVQEMRRSGRLPLAGRDAELAALTAALDAAVEGRGQVAEIIGEPGLGKTRLVEQLREDTAARFGAHVELRLVQCEQYEMSTPYFAVRLLVRAVLGLHSDAGAHDLAGSIAEHAPQLQPWVPLLGDVLGIAVDDSPETKDLAPKFRKERIKRVVDELLTALCPGPAVLIFEDAQWLDAASADVLSRLTATTRKRRWLLCTTRRPGAEPVPPGASPDVVIELEPLSEEDALSLVSVATRDRPLPPQRRSEVVARAGGNPLFLEELIRSAVDGDLGDEEALPESVESVLASQIDDLPVNTRRLLRFASVLGSAFETELLEEVVAPLADLDVRAALVRLQDHLVTEHDGRLRFRHRLVRDIAYTTLPFRRRQEIHASAAAAITAATSESDLDHRSAVLALHHHRAQSWAAAWEMGLRAGAYAQRRYANTEAMQSYRLALDAARRLHDLPAPALAGAWEQLAVAANALGSFASAKAALREAARLREGDATARAALYHRQAGVAERAGNPQASLRWVLRGLREIGESSDPVARALRADLLVLQAWARLNSGKLREAKRLCSEAIKDARAGDNPNGLASALWVLDSANIALGQPALATHGDEAIALYEAAGAIGEQAVLLNNLGAFAYQQGRWADALSLYQRATAAFDRIGDAVFAIVSSCNVAEIFAYQGQLDEAEKQVQAALSTSRGLGQTYLEALAVRHLGRIALRRGDLAAAVEHLSAARATFIAVGVAPKIVEVDVWLAEAALRQGRVDEARALLHESLDRARQLEAVEHLPTIHRLLGCAAAAQGRLLDGWASLDESLAIARAAGAPFEVALTLEAMSAVAELGGPAVPPEATTERNAILASLGIDATPPPPIGGGDVSS